MANVEEGDIQSGNEYVKALKEVAGKEGAEVIMVSASIESQIAELDPEEREMFLAEYGLKASGLTRTIRRGWKAPQAAGVIHTDFERGFIKAEVIKLPDYEKYKTELGCREAGKISIEGKEYVVRDGDIMHFRFNV